MDEETKYYVDDCVGIADDKESGEFAVSANNPDGFLTLIPLGKGLPRRVLPSLVYLIKSRIRELRAIKSFPDFIKMITNVEATYDPKFKKKKKVKDEGKTVAL